jgi:hypothetical protein
VSETLFDLPVPEPSEPRGRRQPTRRQAADLVVFETWIDRSFRCGHKTPPTRAADVPEACPRCGCDDHAPDVTFRQSRMESPS